jgi:2-oxoglutarate ferredoxin oxidoreductase subunit delta
MTTPTKAFTTPRTPAKAGRAPIVSHPAAVRGIVLIRKNHCKGCELCIEFCPKDVLARSKGYNPKGYHYPVVTKAECINCRLCVTICPEYAIFSMAATDRTQGASAAATIPGGQA